MPAALDWRLFAVLFVLFNAFVSPESIDHDGQGHSWLLGDQNAQIDNLDIDSLSAGDYAVVHRRLAEGAQRNNQRRNEKNNLRKKDPNTLEFSLENLANTTTTPARCGKFKCLFFLKHHPDVGYVVAHGLFERRFRMSWNHTKNELEVRFPGVNHILLAPPRRVKISQATAEHINSNLVMALFRKRSTTKLKGKQKHSPRYTHLRPLFVQMVRVLGDADAIPLGCNDEKVRYAWKHVEEFLWNVGSGPWDDPSKDRPDGAERRIQEQYGSFRETLRREMALTQRILHTMPCYQNDFQVFVNRTGHVVHFDLDRCFPPVIVASSEVRSCAAQLHRIWHYMDQTALAQSREDTRALPDKEL